MAPRGRSKKRLSRMDAAVDAMAPLGFDERLVKKTVNKLLKLYGGDESWKFIAEYGYNVLLEALLSDQDEQQPQTHMQGISSLDEGPEDPALDSTIGPSGTIVDSTCNEQSAIGPPSGALVISTCNEAGNTVGETACSEPVNAVGEPTHEELCSNKQDIGSSEVFCPPPAEGGRNRWKDIGEDRPSIEKGVAKAACSDGGNSVNPGSKSHVFATPPTSSPCPVSHLKMCSGSRVLQVGSNSHVLAPPPTSSSCPASNLKMSSGSQVQSRRNSHVSTLPATSSCTVKNLPPPADDCPTTLPSSKPVSIQPPRRRFPCYGWIEDDEEDAEDFIQLQPMKPTTPLQSQNSSGGTRKHMKRKSRWDITPYDL
ncbi:uncharacterized protein LOC132055667 isoform X1 [Lycium ferocissimum]|uniref:uncharacterized protein LOC132055667 isoform X1 n=1 Tax=Lycium ferocissimum TaxID=112874 RepID=UPI00281500DA|nr:uncharacterized protein LOC132055667 isoform X1 [Lycium ferocissimum]